MARGPTLLRDLFFRGSRFSCPLCGRTARCFVAFGVRYRRAHVRCPYCNSWDRHRMAFFYLTRETDLLDPKPKRLLHLAPDRAFSDYLQKLGHIDYLSGDLEIDHQHRIAMEAIDVTRIGYPDASFDIVYCSHVLEHVPDDARGMAEMFRVLKPGGWALIMVPLKPGRTIEDPTLDREEDRLRYFEQPDHVRIYGEDLADRLRAAGFAVSIERYYERLPEEDATRYALNPDDVLFMCRKTVAPR